MFGWLNGYRTYASAAVIGLLAVAQALGYPVPAWAFTLAGAAGLGALRAAVK
jgi:hypothetical protein